MKKILITGGSGLVGKALTNKLIENGYSINWLSHTGQMVPKVTTFSWDLKKRYIDKKAFDGVSYIVHLAGANISEKRWTKKYKKVIADSRIQTAQLLFDYVKKMHVPLQAFISASAIGYYGTLTSAFFFTESSPPGNDFLANVCINWENKANQFSKELNIRTVCLRTGIILSANGGALPKMRSPIQLGVGTALGNGKQYMPWIHIEDLVRMYIAAIESENMLGSYNATAPEQVTNKEVTQKISNILERSLWLPNIPTFVLRTILGERANLLLKGSKVFPQRLSDETTFSFIYDKCEKAIASILSKS